MCLWRQELYLECVYLISVWVSEKERERKCVLVYLIVIVSQWACASKIEWVRLYLCVGEITRVYIIVSLKIKVYTKTRRLVIMVVWMIERDVCVCKGKFVWSDESLWMRWKNKPSLPLNLKRSSCSHDPPVSEDRFSALMAQLSRWSQLLSITADRVKHYFPSPSSQRRFP